jgi:hypothetical protein
MNLRVPKPWSYLVGRKRQRYDCFVGKVNGWRIILVYSNFLSRMVNLDSEEKVGTSS